ncbi:tyrosine-type recombinase/integrase [Aurantimonas endophytica]|uniref:Integrase n=1 Tax=Aurantimonas endophytica TaxID=1522175 RepID=A0A7W6HCH4_9HYPH|nr:site-specific integrase [Aurantimonas endophytica]MBB4002631.1 integrase [Aurantimonas endophytica]MCO6403512.1 integrase arm-type DNA-binding domain-containing protein [Aurantimonas endophytica]
MAKHKLADSNLKSLTKAGVYSDGDGLYLRVRPGGSKQWIFIYRRGGVRKEIGLGGYGQGTAPVSLKLAREKAEAVRDKLARGEDPRGGRKAAVPSRKTLPTFRECMDATIALKEQEFRNAKHRAQWRMTLDKYAEPLHDKPVASVTVDDVVSTLEPHWSKRPETADRLRQRIASVMDYAKARGLRQGDNPAEWKGNLSHLLPARQKLSRGHHAALPYAAAPAMCVKLRQSKGTAARAVEFIALTAARTGEAREATWDEIDFRTAVWTIPGARMKAGVVHRVPLTERAVAILRERQEQATGEYVFGGAVGGAPVSATAMTKALRLAAPNGVHCTLHGLRSMFRDFCGEETDAPREVAEMALAHHVGNAVERAYRRGDALEKRRAVMDSWARYLGTDVNVR